ncbi:hypothetical protein SUGI_0497010 [Cryptomeria japonica]|nr:hypothetical protein SUGI_0497010 [Cryptomeria japonica]
MQDTRRKGPGMGRKKDLLSSNSLRVSRSSTVYLSPIIKLESPFQQTLHQLGIWEIGVWTQSPTDPLVVKSAQLSSSATMM